MIGHGIAAARIAALCLLASAAALPRAVAEPAGARTCSGCHAPAGIDAAIPSIAGRPAEEIVAAMAAFRTDEREATVMGRIAKGFTDDETRAIADWIAAHPSAEP